MKYKLNKAEFDALSPEMQKLYAASGGDYVLQVEGMPKTDDNSGLANKNSELLDELKSFKAKAREEADAKTKAEEDAAKKAGDLEALEKSWGEKFAKQETEKQATIDSLNSSLNSLLVDSQAQKIAHEIGLPESAELLIPHIKQRLAVEERDGTHITAVRGADGKASALTIDELKQEFIGNKAFAPVIAANKANGGGATGGLGGGGATDKKPEDMTESERVELFKQNPEQFKEAFGNLGA